MNIEQGILNYEQDDKTSSIVRVDTAHLAAP